MRFVFIWEQTATCATYSLNWLDFLTEMKRVSSAVRTGTLNKAVCPSSLKGYVLLNSTALQVQLADLRGSKNPLLNNTALHYCCRRTDFEKYSKDSLYSFVPFLLVTRRQKEPGRMPGPREPHFENQRFTRAIVTTDETHHITSNTFTGWVSIMNTLHSAFVAT